MASHHIGALYAAMNSSRLEFPTKKRPAEPEIVFSFSPSETDRLQDKIQKFVPTQDKKKKPKLAVLPEVSPALDLHRTTSRFNCFFSFCPDWTFNRTKNSFIRSAKHVKKYCKELHQAYELVRTELRFPFFDEKSIHTTHLASQIWVAAYGVKELIESEPKSASKWYVSDKLCVAFSGVIFEGEKTVGVLAHFIRGINVLSNEAFAYVDRMNKMMTRLEQPDKKRTDEALTKKPLLVEGQRSVKDIVLSGSKIKYTGKYEVFNMFMRTVESQVWYHFSSYSSDLMLSVILTSLNDVTEQLMRVSDSLHPAIGILRRATCSLFCASLIPHLKDMLRKLKKMYTADMHCVRHRRELRAEIRNIVKYVNDIESAGRKLYQQVMEVLLMGYLCYDYVRSLVPFDDYQSSIKKHWDINFRESSMPYELRAFTPENFFDTRYPDALRKLPVVIGQVELCFHKQASEAALLAQQEAIRLEIERRTAISTKKAGLMISKKAIAEAAAAEKKAAQDAANAKIDALIADSPKRLTVNIVSQVPHPMDEEYERIGRAHAERAYAEQDRLLAEEKAQAQAQPPPPPTQ